jgi:hypothetical protein
MIGCGLASSCDLLDQDVRNVPPERGLFQTQAQADRATREWWEHRIDEMPLDELAVYAGVSEVHRQHGSSATYCSFFVGFTNGGRYTEETRLPCPPPDYAFPRMRARLQGYQPPGKETDPRISPPHFMALWCHGCDGGEAVALWKVMAEWVVKTGRVGCTKEEAEALWKEAEAKYRTAKVPE